MRHAFFYKFRSYRIQKLSEAGFFYAWKQKGLPIKNPCSANADTQAAKKLTNGDLALTYAIVGILFALAFISFCFENFIGRMIIRKQSRAKEQANNLLTEFKKKFVEKKLFNDHHKKLDDQKTVLKTADGNLVYIPSLYYSHEYGKY